MIEESGISLCSFLGHNTMQEANSALTKTVGEPWSTRAQTGKGDSMKGEEMDLSTHRWGTESPCSTEGDTYSCPSSDAIEELEESPTISLVLDRADDVVCKVRPAIMVFLQAS